MGREIIDVELTAKERALILRHGYPFDGIRTALEAVKRGDDIEIIPMDDFELEKLIGDLCISINNMNPGAAQNRLLDLCDRLEAAQRYGDGLLEEW